MEGAGAGCSLPGAQRQDGWPEAEAAFFLVPIYPGNLVGDSPVLERNNVTSEAPRDTSNISSSSLGQAAHFPTSQSPTMAKGLNTGKRACNLEARRRFGVLASQ